MTLHKILSLDELLSRLGKHRSRRERLVLTNGCFDLFHAGHLASLEESKALGDVLVVAVNSDASVRRLKGPTRPIVSERERAQILAGLVCVDYVVLFDEDTPCALLKATRPDVLAKGGTTPEVVGREIVEAYGGRVVRTGTLSSLSTTARVVTIAARSHT